MRLSRFNLYVEDYPESGGTLVHNTLSGAFSILDDETLEAARKADDGSVLSRPERELIDDMELMDPDVGILVESHEKEEAEFQAWFFARRSRTTSLDVLVGVNLACNFNCPYCSQAGILDGTAMSAAIADQVAEWIGARAVRAGVQSIYLVFCGGEPLLHPQRITQIVRRVRERSDIPVTFMLVTNGYFLSPEMVTALVPEGLVKAKVTLDGDETTHSLTRVSKIGEDTFQRVFNNIVAASHHLRIALNGNYQPNTVGGFGPLVKKLADAGLAPESSVHFSPALAGLDAAESAGSGSCSWSGSDTTVQTALHDEILRRGFQTAPLDVIGPCEFHDHHSFAIDPRGAIFKCPGFLDNPDWAIGHVSSGLAERYEEMLTLTPKAQPCSGCAHRPRCGGGCVAAEWLRVGHTDAVNCEKGYFESVKDEALVRNFLLATNDTVSGAVEAFPAPRTQLPTGKARSSSAGRRPATLRVLAT